VGIVVGGWLACAVTLIASNVVGFLADAGLLFAGLLFDVVVVDEGGL
jgi:hypothetical protein